MDVDALRQQGASAETVMGVNSDIGLQLEPSFSTGQDDVLGKHAACAGQYAAGSSVHQPRT